MFGPQKRVNMFLPQDVYTDIRFTIFHGWLGLYEYSDFNIIENCFCLLQLQQFHLHTEGSGENYLSRSDVEMRISFTLMSCQKMSCYVAFEKICYHNNYAGLCWH